MNYKTKVNVISNEKIYPRGSILPKSISEADMAFLKAKGFVVPADVAPAACEEADDYMEPGYERGDNADGLGGLDELGLFAQKSPDEIRKIRSKKEVKAYADAIGFDLGGDYEDKSLKDLQTAVIDFQEEQAEDGGKDG